MKKKVCFSVVLFLVLSCVVLTAQESVETSDADRRIFTEAVSALEKYSELPEDELLVKCALYFMGTPYVAGTIENIPERLTINLHQTDCILFVEMCMGFVQVIQMDHPTFDDFCGVIQKMRYRGGLVEGYDSRIHYTSEWIQQNQDNGLLTEITAKMGVPRKEKFSYMSSHPDSYRQLKDSHDLTIRIKRMEDRLTAAGPYYYIPNDMLKKAVNENKINDGDILCFVTPIEGVDISHVGIAYRQKGELHFIHASSKEKKVVVEKKTLIDYAKNGIRVLRLTVN